MSSLSPDERQIKILEMLTDHPRLSVSDLSAHFGTSEDSIRRDLRALSDAGQIRRVHGAVLAASPQPTRYDDRRLERKAGKLAIAGEVIGRLKPGATLLLDSGTTTLVLAEALPPDLPLTVVTTNLPAALVLADKPLVTTILVGGTLDRDSRSVVGAQALTLLQGIRADCCVLASCSVDPDVGLGAMLFEESLIKRAMVAAAARTIVVATADKLGCSTSFFVAPLDETTEIIADRAPSEALFRRFKSRNIALTIAES